MSVVLSPPVCSHLLQQPRRTHTASCWAGSFLRHMGLLRWANLAQRLLDSHAETFKDWPVSEDSSSAVSFLPLALHPTLKAPPAASRFPPQVGRNCFSEDPNRHSHVSDSAVGKTLPRLLPLLLLPFCFFLKYFKANPIQQGISPLRISAHIS